MKQFNFLILFSILIFFVEAQCVPQTIIFDDFESYSAGSGQPIPPCWSSIDDPFAIGLRDDPSEAYSGNNNLYIYTFFTSNDITYIISPELSTIDGNHFASFYAKSTETNATIQYGTLSDNTNASTFTAFGNTISLTNSYQQYVTPNINSTTGHKYFVFKLVSPSMHTSTRIDDFSWSANNIPCNNVSNIEVDNISSNSAIISWSGVVNSNTYTIEYGLSGFASGNGMSIVTTDTSIELSGLDFDENYDFYIQSNCASDSSSFGTVNTFTTLNNTVVPCNVVTNIQVLDLQEETVTISWSTSQNSINYTIEYGLNGFILGSGMSETVNDTSVVLTGLTPNSNYDFYIQTNCSLDSSNFSTVHQFTTIEIITPCLVIDTLFDDFESYLVGDLPNCWSSVQTPFAIGIRDTPNEAFSGNNSLFIYSFFDYNDTTYLISPELNTINGNYYADFQIKANFVDAKFQYGTMSDNTDSSSYIPISDWLSLDSLYTNIKTENIIANGGHKYFVIKTVSPSQHTSIRIDDFLWAKSIDTTTNTVGIIENDFLDLTVYPNPTNDFIHIKTSVELTQVKLYNLLGVLVAEYKNDKFIDVSHFNKGIYFLEIKSLNSTSIIKIRID